MNEVLRNALMNGWTITIGGGLIVAAFSYILWPRKGDGEQKDKPTQQNQNVAQTVIVSDKYNATGRDAEKKINESEQVHYLKSILKILFIEDGVFKKIDNLKKFGWQISQVKKVDNLFTDEIENADIIFVDYKGVGELAEDQGVGIVRRLKESYGGSKWIIFYSAHPLSLDVHDKGADSFLAKNADVYEMEKKIIEGGKKLKNDLPRAQG